MCYTSTILNDLKSIVVEDARQGILPNGCGPEWTPELVTNYLNNKAEGRAKATCDQHDKDYSTLGMSKSQADYNFKKNLQAAGVPDWWMYN